MRPFAETTYRIACRGALFCARGQPGSITAPLASRLCVVPKRGAIGSADVPFEVLATLGCAVVTGVGAVTNAACARSGDSAVLIGAGGVGLNVAQGLELAGCYPIIAIDLRPSALTLALEFGATHTIMQYRKP